jgi:hypothetical protein
MNDKKLNFVGQIVQQDGTMIGVIDNGESYTITTDHPHYNKLKDAFVYKDAGTFFELVEVPSEEQLFQQVADLGNGRVDVSVEDGVLMLNGSPITNAIATAVSRFWHQGFDFEPLVKFFERLMHNPSSRSVQELFTFLEACNLTVTEDGCFLAYKSVRDDYLDKYSGKFDNSPGSVHTVSRNQVDDDCTKACSHGFHVGALDYAGPGGWYNSNGDIVVICKVDPADVVSVPKDASCQKLRCCHYQVVSDFKSELKGACYSGEVAEDDNDYDYKEQDLDMEWDFIESVDDMLIGWTYEFEYEDKEGNIKTRHVIVDNTDYNHIYVTLVRPEEDAGQKRTFLKDSIDNIKEFEADVTI